MPRTKVRKTVVRDSEPSKPNKTQLHRSMVNVYIKELDAQWKALTRKMLEQGERVKVEVNQLLLASWLEVPHYDGKTVAELKIDPVKNDTLYSSNASAASGNSTRSGRYAKTNTKKNVTLKVNKTHSIFKKAKSQRSSRSLSRSKMQLAMSTLNAYKTPNNSQNYTATNTFGLITPKLKPNTPQIFMRRPKQGEMALSMQGSPLLVGSITTDERANVNIPLRDGRVMSIQPRRGLRTSQIPELDIETLREMETLRDNLNKVCAAATQR